MVDVDHKVGVNDDRLRPNQIFAVGGLPYPVLEGELARRVVDVVERQLWTPAGLRSLGPGEPGYIGHYRGDVRHRDGAYHQGTVWPWLDRRVRRSVAPRQGRHEREPDRGGVRDSSRRCSATTR